MNVSTVNEVVRVSDSSGVCKTALISLLSTET